MEKGDKQLLNRSAGFDPLRSWGKKYVAMRQPLKAGAHRGLPRSAVALSLRHALSFPGRALTGPSTVASLIGLGLQGAGIRTVVGGIRWPVSRPPARITSLVAAKERAGGPGQRDQVFFFSPARRRKLSPLSSMRWAL